MKTKESRAKYLAKNTAIFAIGSFATKIITFFLIPIYTNTLVTSEYGVVDLFNTICTVLAPVIIFNVGEAVMRFALDEDADYEKILSIGITFLGVGIMIGLAILPITKLFSELAPYAVYVYFYTITLAASQVLLCYLRGKEQLMMFSLGNIIHSLGIACFNILFLVFMHKGIQGYFTAYILGNLVTIVFAFVVGNVKSVVAKFNLDITLSKEMLRYSVVLIPNTFMWWITNSSDRIMVTAMISTAANGIYAISYKLPSLVQTVANVFNQAWSYSAIRENSSSDRDAYCNKVYMGIVSISVTSAVVLMAIMKPFLRIYVEQSYYEAWKYTPYLLIGYAFLTIGSFLATSYTVNKDSKGYLFSGSCGAIVNILMNLILIPILGIAGAALATCLSYLSVYIYRIFDTKRYITLKILNKKHILAYAVMVLTGFTMYIETGIGQIVLIVEALIEVVLFADVWRPLLNGLKKKING